MTGRLSERYAELVSTYSKPVIVAVLVLTVGVAAGTSLGPEPAERGGAIQVDAPENEAQDFVRSNYGGDDRIVAQVVVRNESGDVLTRESLLEGLRFQRAVRDDEDLNGTLTAPGFAGIENVVASVAVAEDARMQGGQPPRGAPSLDDQIAALENRNETEVEALLDRVLDPNASAAATGGQDPYTALPRGYTPGETDAGARLTTVFQVNESEGDEAAAYDAQVRMDELVEQRFDDAFLFGPGINDDASSRAIGDSFAIITPFALVLIVVALGLAYRDLLDILLAFGGIAVVMVWYTGVVGWLAIPSGNQILIAVPFLLIGLSLDYAIHVVMRYREAREGELDAESVAGDGGASIRTAMALGLGGVVLALAAATVSTGVGFLSNVVSPLPEIREFAVVSAAGILGTFVVFGALLPAIKIELDSLVEGRIGWGRRKPAFGVDTGLVNRALKGLSGLTTRAPMAILAVGVVLAAGGAVGATTIDTEFNEADFLPEDPPEWSKQLPGPLETGTYTIREEFEYLSENFHLGGSDGQSQVLIRGSVSDPELLRALDVASAGVEGDSSIQFRADGTAAIEGPHTVIRDVAAENATVGEAVDRADTDDDGLPDENVTAVYGLVFGADEEAASSVLSRSDGEITSARLLVDVRSSESAQTIASDTRTLAVAIEDGAPDVSAIATGRPVTQAVNQDALLETLVQGFAVTLVVILAFLTVLFRVRYGSLSYGLVVVTPVVIALCWLLGGMKLLGLPFNSETAVITSLAIGLGVDYSIHAGERFVTERERQDSLDAALRRTITGTGGALLASATTTASGFGVLALALAPPLQRFGIVTGTAIVLAFISCLTILPSLLVARERLRERFGSAAADTA